MGTFGTTTAAIVAGGTTSTGATAQTESWNGTNWTEVNDLGTARRYMAGCGTQPAGLVFGGSGPATGATELWDGTNWSEQNDLNTARDRLAGAGTTTNAVGFGGSPVGSVGANTEEWTVPGTVVKSISTD